MKIFHIFIFCCLLFCLTSAILDERHPGRRNRGRGAPIKIPEGEESKPSNTIDPSQSEVVIRPWLNLDDNRGFFEEHSNLEQTSWWKGPNVCNRTTTAIISTNGSVSTHNLFNVFGQFNFEILTNRNNRIQNYHFVSVSLQCEALSNAYRCVTIQEKNKNVERSMKIYECCPGYSRKPTSQGCTEKISPKSLNLVLDDLDLSILHEAFDSLKINWANESGSTKKTTIFAPPKAELEKIKLNNSNTMSNNVLEITPELIEEVNELRTRFAGHVIKGGVIREADIYDGLVVKTEGESSIRFGVFSRPSKMQTKFVTANCVPLVAFDVLASNGVVHRSSSILPLNKFSLLQIIANHPQLTTLYKLIVEHKAEDLLVSTDSKPISVFAPTDFAFKKLSMSSSKLCFQNFLKSLIIDEHVCLSSIFAQSKFKDLLGNQRTITALYNNVSRLLTGHMMDHDVEVVESDLVATGSAVLHLIGKVEVTDRAMSYIELGHRMKSEKFMELVEKAEKLGFQPNNQSLLFLPSNEAIQKVEKDMLTTFDKSSEKLLNFVKFHFYDSSASQDANRLRLSRYNTVPYGRRSVVTAQCIPLKEKPRQSCDVQIYPINSALISPTNDIFGELASRSDLNDWMSIVKHANLMDFIKNLTDATVLAPSNKAIQSLGRSFVNQLKVDKEKAGLFVKQHIVKGVVCCSGIMERDWLESNPNLPTYSNRPVSFERRRNQLYVSKNSIQSCGDSKMSTNGVIHVLDRAIPLVINVVKPNSHNTQNIWSFLEALMNEHLFQETDSSSVDEDAESIDDWA